MVRLAPVALAMRGTRLRSDTVALMGWFGPRGLASVVFSLLALVEFEAAGRPIDVLVPVVVWTILLSVIAHGLSANPLAGWYARRLEAARKSQPDLAELADLSELRKRRHILPGPPSQLNRG